MIYKSFHPSPALKEFVRNYTLAHFQFKDAQAIPSKHRPPKPEQGLVFYLKGFVNQHNLTSGSQQIPATVSLFSHQTDKKLLQVSSEFFMFTIFFHPGIL